MSKESPNIVTGFLLETYSGKKIESKKPNYQSN